DDDLLDDDEPLAVPPKAAKKKPAFFAWVSGEKQDGTERKEVAPAAEDELQDDEPPLVGIGGWQQDSQPAWPDHDVQPADAGGSELPPWEEPAQPVEAVQLWPEALEPADGASEGQLQLPIDEEPENGGTAADNGIAADPAAAMPGGAAPPPSKPYLLPPLTLLAKPQHGKSGPADTGEAKRKLDATLESFGVKATVLDVVRGPAVTRYEVQPATGVKVSRIVGLTDDIALALAAKDIRMEAPIPGKSAIGIEVPNTEVSM